MKPGLNDELCGQAWTEQDVSGPQDERKTPRIFDCRLESTFTARGRTHRFEDSSRNMYRKEMAAGRGLHRAALLHGPDRYRPNAASKRGTAGRTYRRRAGRYRYADGAVSA